MIGNFPFILWFYHALPVKITQAVAAAATAYRAIAAAAGGRRVAREEQLVQREHGLEALRARAPVGRLAEPEPN